MGENQPQQSAVADAAAAEHLQALRTRAETLSRELLAEREPRYLPDEQQILRLEMAFGERSRHDREAG